MKRVRFLQTTLLKKFFKIAFVFNIIIIVLLVLPVVYWKKTTAPISPTSSPKSFLVTKGSSATLVGKSLEKQGFIRNGTLFRFYLKFSGKDQKIIPGSYQISPSLGMVEIADVLIKGPKDLWVLVPEGLRREEIAEIFVKDLEKTPAESDQFREEFLRESADKEGFLFPDTYLFPREVKAASVVKKMEQTFDSQMIQFHSALIDEKTAGGLNLKEIAILASIIERESKGDDERPIVAGILLNRLKIGMGLQADATVQYALASLKCKVQSAKCQNWWPTVLKDDLKINSPFNTYKNVGLPPAPISNPGLSSIKAVIYPQKSDFLYYLHDRNGKIHTATSFEEHSRNIQEFLR